MLHVIENELGASLAADRRIAGREKLECHRAERTAAGRQPRLQWIWAQRILPGASVHADRREQASSLLQYSYFDQSITADFRTKLSLPPAIARHKPSNGI
jgi:hypothetical protein